VLIVTDDLGWRDLGAYGSGFYETPHLDRLVAGGMCFSDAYAACPVCSPSRASILSGQYPARLGLTNYLGGTARGRLLEAPYIDRLPPAADRLPSLLAAAGYRTWHVGKWHLGDRPAHPEAHGFQVNVAGCAWGHPHRGHWSPWGIPTLTESAPGTYLADRLTDEAVALVAAAGTAPFFLNFWPYAVHTPIQAPADLVAKYRDKARRLGLDRLPALEPGEFFPCAHKRDQRVVRRRLQSDPTYAAMIENLDANVGRLLQAVAAAGPERPTLVVFTSDNGGLATSEGSPTCNAPLAEGKGWMYDGGVRVPLVVSWPGVVRPGSRCPTPVIGPDLYPTLLEAAGVSGAAVDGRSLLPLLREEPVAPRPLFWHYPHYGNQGGTPGSAVRLGAHKLLEFFEDGRTELYDLEADCSESRDLAAARPDLARELGQLLGRWRDAVGARLPVPDPDWR